MVDQAAVPLGQCLHPNNNNNALGPWERNTYPPRQSMQWTVHNPSPWWATCGGSRRQRCRRRCLNPSSRILRRTPSRIFPPSPVGNHSIGYFLGRLLWRRGSLIDPDSYRSFRGCPAVLGLHQLVHVGWCHCKCYSPFSSTPWNFPYTCNNSFYPIQMFDIFGPYVNIFACVRAWMIYSYFCWSSNFHVPNFAHAEKTCRLFFFFVTSHLHRRFQVSGLISEFNRVILDHSSNSRSIGSETTPLRIRLPS